MSGQNELVDLLNDLIRINHDRASGYRKVIEELKATDIDLKTMFTNMANNSTQFHTELEETVKTLGGEAVKDSSNAGRIYRIWMDIRSSATAHDRKSIISLCELGEDAALKSYNSALEAGSIPEEIRQILVDQRSNIQSSHEVVKRYRDMHAAVPR